MNCPKCGARIMEGADVCVRCGTRLNGSGNAKQNTYIVNGQVLDASRTVLDDKDIGRRRKNFLGPIFIISLLVGLGYLIVTYFPIEDFKNIFNSTSDSIAITIARKTLNNARDYYISLLYENGRQSMIGQEFDIHVLDEKYKDSKVESGKFYIYDSSEYGIELRDVMIQGYTCNGTIETLKCETSNSGELSDDDLSALLK